MSTIGGANSWNPAGLIILGVTVVATIAIYAIPWDSVARSASNTWDRIQSSARSSSITKAISKAVSKAKSKIKKEKKKYDYWIASYIEYEDGRGTYIPTTQISYSKAKSYVRAGGSVFAASKSKAYKLAKAVGNGHVPAKPERHSDKNGSTLGYWWHYHAYWGGKRIGGHVFYVK